MLLEITSLCVNAGQETAFEQAFQTAQPRIARTTGYITHELQRDVLQSGRYALLIEWRDDTPGRQEAAWRTPLQAFLMAPPDTRHYELIAGRGIPPHVPALRYPD